MKNKIYRFFTILSVTILMLVSGACDEDLLEKNPTDKLSEGTFWKTEKDAMLALTGVYHDGPRVGRDAPYRYTFWSGSTLLRFDLMTDNGDEKDRRLEPLTDGNLTSGYWIIQEYWGQAWDKLVRCNNFLDNISDVEMDEQERNEMIAEVKFIRAFYYFWMSQLWGGVPLVTTVLDYDDANSVSRASKDDIVNFVLNELTDAASNLPDERPDSEYGRITKAAALAIKGRLLMAEKRWSEAAQAYEQIIDMNLYGLHPNYLEIFEDGGEMNDELILVFPRVEDLFGEDYVKHCRPASYKGWHQFNAFNNLVEDYEMIDGKTIHESPLYEIHNPYENRDPRMDMTVFISQRTVFQGKQLYDARPNSKTKDRLTRRHFTGYAIRKFADEDYDGDIDQYGGDWPVIRYAEVLLSYLESKLEAGDPIDQNLLDQTINLVRGRETVNMPAVTETDTDKLREILRRERRVELAFEGLRLFDLFRWRIAHIKLDEKVYGMKLTDDPENYDDFIIDENGYYFYEDPNFRENVDYLWPIPQTERDINSNLTQNPGY